MVKRDISIIETKRVRDRLQEIEKETKLHSATYDDLGLKYVFVECLDGEDYDDVYRQIGDFYRAALLRKEMDEDPEPSIIEKLSELSLDYIAEKSLTSALCGVDDKTVLIDDLRPLELNDELAERTDEAIPLESLDRVDEDIKQNFFGDKNGRRHWDFYEEREKQTEYDRFVRVLDNFVSDKMTSLTKRLVTEPNGWSFQAIVKDRKFPKWKWFRPDVHVESKRIFDLWCGEFLEHRDMPISYMWSFLKSRLIINGWTNRGLGRKEWDWSEETTKVINNEGHNRDTFDKEYPAPRFEYSKDWLNAERVEINYLQAIEEMLMNKWNKQSEKTAPIIDLSKWSELCNLLHKLQKGKKIIVRNYIDPKVFIVKGAFSISREVKSIYCCPPFDDIDSSITIHYKNDKEDVVNVVNFSKYEHDEKKNIVTVWLTENILDEEYKAFDVLFISEDEQLIDEVDKVEKFKEAIDSEIEEINSSIEKR
ncbi:MAG: hypothetical protein J6R59_03135 [Paludibacteraceae bacterium]|nr:hypothetical protein [Paludibacteraceae bacterium]